MITIMIFLLVGLVLLFAGAEALVRGSAQVALRLGISPLIVGLTVVAFGTSTPELVVSVSSAFNGMGDVAIGNVVGSNIFNIAFILGISACITPLRVNVQLLRIDGPIMVGVSLLLVVLLLDHHLSRIEAVILLAGIAAYTFFTIRFARSNPQATAPVAAEVAVKGSVLQQICLIAVGLGALVGGSHFFVKGAVLLATSLKVSQAVIGLTIIAAGTSLPELATSVLAAIRKQQDIAIGNVVGSNIFNILGILGVSGIVSPLSGGGITVTDYSFLVGTAVLTLPLMFSGFRLSRIEGGLFIAIYGGYLFLLWPK